MSIIQLLTVLTTLHQATTAHKTSKIAAIIIAHFRVMAQDQTAGQTLLATSLAQILTAIYIQKNTASNKKALADVHKSDQTKI